MTFFSLKVSFLQLLTTLRFSKSVSFIMRRKASFLLLSRRFVASLLRSLPAWLRCLSVCGGRSFSPPPSLSNNARILQSCVGRPEGASALDWILLHLFT